MKNDYSKKNILIFSNLLLNLILCFGMIYSLYIILFDYTFNVISSMKIFGVLSIVLVLRSFFSNKISNFSPGHIFLLYMILSYFGYSILVLFCGQTAFDAISSSRHAYINYYNLSNAYHYIGIFVFLMAYISVNYNKTNSVNRRDDLHYYSEASKELYMYSSKMLITLYTLILIILSAIGIIPVTNYAAVKEWFASQTVLSYLLKFVWIAIPTYFYFCENKKDYFKVFPQLLFLFFIMMLTGNRNEILYPLATSFGVVVWKNRKKNDIFKIPKYIYIIIIVIIFVFNPLISSTRKTGIGLNTLINGDFGVYESLMEMGQQINPFSITLYALDNNITTYRYGSTYIVPTLSILSLNTIYKTSDFLNSLKYNPTVLLNSLGHYGRGFSLILEIYYNFGLIGIIVGLFILGKFISISENKIKSEKKILFYFQLTPLLMLLCRNIFGFNIIIFIFIFLYNFVIEKILVKKGRWK